MTNQKTQTRLIRRVGRGRGCEQRRESPLQSDDEAAIRLAASAPADAQDVNGFYVLDTTAEQYGISKISDLTVEQ